MTLTVDFPSAILGELQAKSIATGKPVATLVAEAVEADLMLDRISLKDAIRPLREDIAASGLSPDEAEAFLADELTAHRAERGGGSGSS